MTNATNDHLYYLKQSTHNIYPLNGDMALDHR